MMVIPQWILLWEVFLYFIIAGLWPSPGKHSQVSWKVLLTFWKVSKVWVWKPCCVSYHVVKEIVNVSAVVAIGSPMTSDVSSATNFGAAKLPPLIVQDRQLFSYPINCYYGYDYFNNLFLLFPVCSDWITASIQAICQGKHWLELLADATCWWRGTVVEPWSLTDELSLSCARPAADGWPLMWVSHPLQVSQLGQLSFSSFRGR